LNRLLSPARLAILVALAAVLALLGYGIAQNDPDTSIESALARGERPDAPDLTLPRLAGGGGGSLDDYRGRVVVLNFWASWCEPCKEESPLLERWHRRISARGGMVLGVDVHDVTSDARSFVRRYGLTYPMLRDRDGDRQDEFGVAAYPETFVIDRAGRIAAIARGPVDDDFLEREVLPVLAERG
jgi:cytochrome c biogenesis protein CcmG/thiol:disulfide interchange protein DsbE